MNVVIAGGTGLIGGAIVTELRRRGDSVTVLSRSAAQPSHSGIQILPWDAKNPGPWTDCIAQCDAVVNLCGSSIGAGRWTKKQKKKILESRLKATAALVDAMKQAPRRPVVLVNGSAVGYYGNVEEGEVTESHPPGTDFLAQVCVAWEAAARNAESHGVRVVLPRTGFVLAQNAEALKKMLMPFRLFVGGRFGSGRQWFPWIHLQDVVRGYLHAVETSSLSGPVNLSAPNPVQVSELAREIGRALRRPAVLPTPSLALKLVLGEMSDLLLKGQRVIPAKLAHTGFTFRFPLLSDALEQVLQKT